jgi:hypothetical protein
MIQGQCNLSSGRQRFLTPRRDPLLQRHPVLIPIALLSGAVVLCIASFFASTLFPVMTLLRIPTGSLCLLFAFVSGISGILTSIIGLIERVDRPRLHAEMFPQPKEGT